jgi:hypothetical protein
MRKVKKNKGKEERFILTGEQMTKTFKKQRATVA